MQQCHDTCSIAALVHQLNAPQAKHSWSKPRRFPRMESRQGWYSTGFGYGTWVGILMVSGFQVVPMWAQAWKTAAGICGRGYTISAN
ncbi:hypothetical protein CY35_05G139000 [Sphagnum magellanicum]|nr:hypothetical protein CY35_05G139000 [Sphagnum magellanicum]